MRRLPNKENLPSAPQLVRNYVDCGQTLQDGCKIYNRTRMSAIFSHQALATNKNAQTIEGECLREMSTIEMLKKEARLLDEEFTEASINRFSTMEFKPAKNTQNHCILKLAPFQKTNYRKVIRGRPELSNWVRKYRKQLASLHSHALNKKQLKLTKVDHVRQEKIDFEDEMSAMSLVGRLKRFEDISEKSNSYQLKKPRKLSLNKCSLPRTKTSN